MYVCVFFVVFSTDDSASLRYTMVFINPLLYLGYKLYHRTRVHLPAEVDLHKNLAEVEEYERNYVPTPPR